MEPGSCPCMPGPGSASVLVDLLEVVAREVDMSATEELEEATATWELDEAGEKGARHAVLQFGPHLPQSPPPCSLAGNAFTEPPVDLLFRAQTHTPSIT
uniref:Uncharacterized protein n=1 Tax=Oryza nivara TaxID=4536 RepID=A0A0E0IJP8_ORYNI